MNYSKNTVAVRMDKDQLAQLKQVKNKTGMTLSFIFGAAISEWLIKHEPGIYDQGVAMHNLNQDKEYNDT